MTRKSIRTAATIGTALACLGGLAACSNDSDSNASGTNGSNGADELAQLPMVSASRAHKNGSTTPNAPQLHLLQPRTCWPAEGAC